MGYIFRGRNKKERLAAAAEIKHEEEKRRAEALRWKAVEETRSEEEQENAAQRKREEARIRHAAEREKAEKRRKAQEAEKRASDDRVKRENERRRLLAFGPPPGKSEHNHGNVRGQLLVSSATLVHKPGRAREVRPPQYKKGQQQIIIVNYIVDSRSRTQLGETASR